MTKIKYAVVGVLLIALDQIIKFWVLVSLAPGSVKVIDNLFYLTYVENRGAAFGVMQDQTTLLSVLTSLVLLVVLVLFFNGKFKGRALEWSVIVGVSGGIGNLIDRVFRGFVVDYLDFSALFGFPVFNFADICVVCGTFAVLICIFLYDDKREQKHPEATGEKHLEDGGAADDREQTEA